MDSPTGKHRQLSWTGERTLGEALAEFEAGCMALLGQEPPPPTPPYGYRRLTKDTAGA
jgi:hypothetical protein